MTNRGFANLLLSFIRKQDGRVWILVLPCSMLSWNILWGLASFVSGLLTGFLFGIPKVLQGKGSTPERGAKSDLAQDSRYQQQVNTNLTEISDWVTKIIVGLGLINLKDIPGKLVAAGNLFAKAVDSHSNISAVPLGVSIIVAFMAKIGKIDKILDTYYLEGDDTLKTTVRQARSLIAQVHGLGNS